MNHCYTFEVFDLRFENIAESRANVFSQFGEDGLLQNIFHRIGSTNRWCFEVGAADGVYLSNTKHLCDNGWKSVLIESSSEKFEKLKTHASDRIAVVNKLIGDHDLDGILAEHGAPHDIDLGVIDIDGRDYFAWEGMIDYRPRVMMVECLGETVADGLTRELLDGQQATSTVLNRLAIKKGYVPICRTFCNCIYIRADL